MRIILYVDLWMLYIACLPKNYTEMSTLCVASLTCTSN